MVIFSPHLLFSKDCTLRLISNRSFPSGITHQRAVNSIIFHSIWPSTSLSSGWHPFCICNRTAWTEIRAFHIEQSLLRDSIVRCITVGGGLHASLLSECRVQRGSCLQPHTDQDLWTAIHHFPFTQIAPTDSSCLHFSVSRLTFKVFVWLNVSV